MKKTFFVFLIVIAAVMGISAQDAGRTATATWQVQKYEMDVTLPADNSRTVAVRAVLNLRNISGQPANRLTLRISPLAEVAGIKINDTAAEFDKSEEKINAAVSLNRLVTRLASVPAQGTVAITVDYKIPVKENTPVGSVSPIQAQFLPLSFWYPTPNSWFFARGADTAPFRVKVNTPAGLSAISAGAEIAGSFESKLAGQPFFVAGNWDSVNHSGVTVMMPKGAAAEGQKRAAELASFLSEAMTFAAGFTGKAVDAPLRVVSVRRGAGFGGAGTVLVDEAVFRRPKLDSLTAMNFAEAAAKLSLGSVVSVTGEGHGAISEGLTRYIATQFIESKFGKDVADVERLRQRTAYAAVSKRDAPISIASPIDDYYYPVVANKGAMAWRLLAKRVGPQEFANAIKTGAQDGNLTLAELRAAFSSQKELANLLFDQVTETNLMVGLPVAGAGESKVALRNSGSSDVTVDIAATTEKGQRLVVPASIKAAEYGEAAFKTAEKIVRVEIDPEKLYPQVDYADDVKPQETTDSDPVLAAKRSFDKQDFAGTEKTARVLLQDFPRLDDLRILLGRSLLAQNKNSEAEREFRAVLDEKLPTARNLAWANVGLAEVASKAGQNENAARFVDAAILADAEYGASYAARNVRNRIGGASAAIDPAIRTFFADFDKAASANRKADVEALTMPGEVTRFVNGLSGSTEQWQSSVRTVDRIDPNTILVEANMTVKLLNRDAENVLAVFRLTRLGSGWKLIAVDVFEVRS